ncbi:ack-related non-receptor tyrosine kinase-like isoform X2 [Homalodisca vitripennis]|uniref:ack-related non-receptor tyrosine kinase-like isoform X2 n=1 Tax=Homalodisca vitripennis TaxID=197043 RepID=UPI001EECCBD5|nr:ack-related non-receptor tyrosine kinase-like isoform X2 [Homalodisca vitripennis]
MTSTKGPGLYDFLIEAELQHYFTSLKNDLKVQTAAQLKFVSDDDLQQLGMSKPEMRRLKKYFQKHFPQNYISKLKKMIVYKKEENGQSLMAAMLSDESLDKPPVRVPNKHIIPADSILVNKELGTGEFGVVQQGVWTNDGERIQVAIKCLSRERMQSNPIEFLKEAAIMHGIEHEHIVRLYGVVLDTNALMLVTELAPLRSLLECLKEPSLRFSFPVLTLCDFAIQICDGMQYLEAKRLIHRDLAARNILVFSKNKVKISDFGLSRALGVGKDYYQTNFNVNLKLPIAWCAPECISYLRFTSASDVWAYGVTLWEMFSYGFQPWAALTGHQILEAIDEPNFQRLEQPDCCPKEYYSLMLKCWQHDPNKRPRFADLMSLLPDYKPEQVQAVQELGDERVKREQLVYRVGEVITVLDKTPVAGVANCWKGVVNSGKTGLFNPAHTVAYLGNNLPSNKPGQFTRGDGKNAYSSRRNRLRPEMISCPQGDVKHTGHVGLDGAYFGDISFLGGTKYDGIPHQVVTPYKPHEDTSAEVETRSCSDRAPLLQSSHSASSNGLSSEWGENKSLTKLLTDHEYHEISDEENTPDSPRFDPFDLGPSLLDEMDAVLRCLGGPPPPPAPPSRPPASPPPPPSPLDDTVNKRNELREMQNTLSKSKKKQATVKPISAADERTLDCAIAMANELAARSMNDLGVGGDRPPSAPLSPTSPTKRKFSFRFPAGPAGAPGTNKQHPRPEGKTFTDEAASIPDIQSLCSSLRSLSSCTSLESLRGGAPFRLPLWDRASAEFCFARSRDLLTRCPPRLDSSVEVLESSEAEETVSASLDLHQKHSEPLRKCLSSDKNNSDYWKMRRPLQDFGRKYKNHDGLSNSCTLSNEGTVTKSQSTDSASTLDACPSITDLNESSTLKDCNGYEHSASLKGLSLSSLNECSNISGYTVTDLNKSSYENMYTLTKSYDNLKSSRQNGLEKVENSFPTNGFEELEKLEAEFRITDPVSEPNLKNGTECSAELKPLSRFLDKFPELDDSPGQSFRPLDKTSLGYSSRGGSDYPSLREVSHSPERLSKYTEKYPRENNQVVRLSFKQLERHLDSLDLNRRSSENISTFDEVSPIGRKEELRRTELFSGRKQFVPQTPVFRRKLSQPKMGESSRRSTKSSPNSPSITSPKVYFRPRTNSLSEEKVRPPPSRRQSYNYSAHYDSSSSDSEFDRPPSLCQVPLTSLRQTRC